MKNGSLGGMWKVERKQTARDRKNARYREEECKV